MPTSTNIPTAAIMLILNPQIHSISNAPVNARGMVTMIMNGDKNDWNCATIIAYIKTIARTIISPKSLNMSVISLFSPISETL